MSRERLATYPASAETQLGRWLTELDQIDRGEDGPGTGCVDALATNAAKLRDQDQGGPALFGQLKESGGGRILLTDPNTRTMAADGKAR